MEQTLALNSETKRKLSWHCKSHLVYYSALKCIQNIDYYYMRVYDECELRVYCTILIAQLIVAIIDAHTRRVHPVVFNFFSNRRPTSALSHSHILADGKR